MFLLRGQNLRRKSNKLYLTHQLYFTYKIGILEYCRGPFRLIISKKLLYPPLKVLGSFSVQTTVIKWFNKRQKISPPPKEKLKFNIFKIFFLNVNFGHLKKYQFFPYLGRKYPEFYAEEKIRKLFFQVTIICRGTKNVSRKA